jgi:hypothetical protein
LGDVVGVLVKVSNPMPVRLPISESSRFHEPFNKPLKTLFQPASSSGPHPAYIRLLA